MRNGARFALAALSALIVSSSGPLGAATVVMVDNPAATFTGTWSTSTSRPDRIGSNYAHNTQLPGLATWTSAIPAAGRWQVEAYWNNNITDGNSRGLASYAITHAGGTSSVTVDQRIANGSWSPLGIYTFAAGSSASVQLTGPNGQYVIADAVRWVNVDELPTVPTSQVSITASSTIGATYLNGRVPEAAVKGYGLSDTNNDGIGETHRRQPTGEQYNWLSNNNDTAGWLKLDLGAPTYLEEMRIWNFQGGEATADRTNRGVQTFDLYWSDSLTDPGIDFAANWNKLNAAPLTLTRAPNADANANPDIFDLPHIGARWLAIDILSNYGDTTFTGLGEIQLFREVPEPATLSLAAAALAGLGGYLRRRPAR